MDAKSVPLEHADAAEQRPDIAAMSWCGVKAGNCHADKVRARTDWTDVPVVRNDHILAISEVFFGRPAAGRRLAAAARCHRDGRRPRHAMIRAASGPPSPAAAPRALV